MFYFISDNPYALGAALEPDHMVKMTESACELADALLKTHEQDGYAPPEALAEKVAMLKGSELWFCSYTAGMLTAISSRKEAYVKTESRLISGIECAEQALELGMRCGALVAKERLEAILSAQRPRFMRDDGLLAKELHGFLKEYGEGSPSHRFDIGSLRPYRFNVLRKALHHGKA